ncbi:MAG: hypothetical protein US74_C0010G0004 [Parcubacteria group bacterium GW2011_GWA2_38_13]|nr:MAG: hypothetical protein US74_C0010G0004 [Parcubacteria group bacterium GW2011_GWA2_38_13]
MPQSEIRISEPSHKMRVVENPQPPERSNQMSEYRDEVRRVSKEVPFTLWMLLKWGVPTILIIASLMFLANSLGIISLNIQREVIQNSQQYVESKVSLINKLHGDWLQLDAEIAEMQAAEAGADGNAEIISAKHAQQKSIVNRLRTEVGMIPSSQVPEAVQAFLSSHTR